MSAGTFTGELLAVGLDAHALELRFETEAAGDAVVQQGDVLVLKLHHPVAIEADEVVVLRFFEKIWVVVSLISAQVHLAEHPAGLHQGDGAIDGGPGYGAVDLAHLVEELLSVEMIVRSKSRFDNDIALLGSPLPLLGEVGIQSLFDIFDHVVPGLRHLAGRCKMVSESGGDSGAETRTPGFSGRFFDHHLFLKVLPC